MLVLSHRGHCASARENTLEAFEHALSLGVDGIETDLRLSADGQIVLFHDRHAPTGRAIAELTHAELSALVGYDVPRLADALALSRDILWNLEIKPAAALEAVLAALPPYLSTHRLLISSARHDVVQRVAAALDVDCGLVVADRPWHFPIPAMFEAVGPGRINALAWNYEWLDPCSVDETAARGLQLFVWGVETAAEHEHCLTMNAAGVITDHIESAKLVVARPTAA